MTDMDSFIERQLSRRRLFAWGGALVGTTALSPLLAACGGDDDDEDPTATSASADADPTATPETGGGDPDPTATDESGGEDPDPTATEPTDTGDSKRGGTVTIGSIQEPDNINPILTAATVGFEITSMIYDPLTVVDPAGSHVAYLASEVPSQQNGGISEDITTYTYTLREGVTWHDGEPFTAADVVFTFETIMDPASNVPSRLGLDDVDTIETPDDHTVVFNLKAPNGVFLEAWGGRGILPKHLFEGEDINTTALNREPGAGTGPYKFVEWVSGDRIVVERNENYYREGAYLDQINYLIVPNSDTLLIMTESGEIDMRFVLTAEHVPLVRELDDYTVLATPGHSYFHFTINQQDPILSDKLVRQALTHGLDKHTITQTVLQDLVVPHWSPLAEPNWAFWDPPEKMDFDLDRAAALLDEAGWLLGGDGVREKDGEKLSLQLMNISGDTERLQIVQLAQAMWKEIGADVSIDAVDLATFIDASTGGTYQFSYGFWGFSVDPFSYAGRWLSDSPSNFLFYGNSEVDDLLEGATRIADRDARKEMYQQFQEIIIDEATNIWMYNRIFFNAVSKRVQGFVPNGGSVNTWNVHEWWIEE